MKICFCSNASPWFFGPYGKQLKYLSEYFAQNDNYTVYYLLLNNDTIIEFNNKIKFLPKINSINNTYLISHINKSLLNENIDKLFFLSDLTKLCFDEEFKVQSFVWYPNHFSPINKTNRDKLSYFDNIISLCETDKKLIKDLFPEKNIFMVPHIIDVEKPSTFDKSDLRKELLFNNDDFIIFMNIGNYDIQNRKSLDTALFAFNEFVKSNTNAILFIHTYDVRKIDVNNKYTPKDNFFEIDDLLFFLDIPSKNIKIINDIIDQELLIKYYLVSDVYMQTSKSEGFGLPVLEAQKLGLPVITTEWGAMSDYNFNGIKVSPCQQLYDNMVRGIWCTPSINGFIKALQKIYTNDYENKRDEASLLVGETMSIKNVSLSIEQILTNTLEEIKTSNIMYFSNPLQIIYYDDNSYLLNNIHYEKLKPIQITGEWVMLINKNAIINKEQIENLCQQYNDADIIGFITKYNNCIFPNNDSMNNSDNIDKMNYVIKSDIIKTVIEQNILVPNMKGFILLTSMNKYKSIISHNILCIENVDI